MNHSSWCYKYNSRPVQTPVGENCSLKTLVREMKWIFIVSCVIGVCWGASEQLPVMGHRKARVLRDGKMVDVKGGLDFGKAVFDQEMGKRCIFREEEIETVEKTPILECTHRSD